NQVPSRVKQLVDSLGRGDLETARSINSALRRLFRINFIESNPGPVKYALARMGMIREIYRLPLVPLAGENKVLIDRELEALGLI
ncbi:MAG: 4-hydroxy-tetrahydrodipicolinate synthase, partial [Chlorobiaceae bacterium]|nr:4-hydroxy-tetrahydrodipicolinate synthase [Chlorobiaceae bacterium]